MNLKNKKHLELFLELLGEQLGLSLADLETIARLAEQRLENGITRKNIEKAKKEDV